MSYEQILKQKPVFDAVIANMQSSEDKITFSKSLGMLDHLFLISKPDEVLYHIILLDHAQYLSHDVLETLDEDQWNIISGDNDTDEEIKYPLTDSFIRKYADKLNWQILCYSYPLSEDILREFKHNWKMLQPNYPLSESFLREFKHKIDWDYVSPSDLSSEFVNEHTNFFDWDVVSEFMKLSEEFQDRLNWRLISGHRKLSKDFIKRFAHKIDFRLLLNSQYAPNINLIADLLTQAYKD